MSDLQEKLDEMWDALNAQREELAALRARVTALEGAKRPASTSEGDTYHPQKRLSPLRQRVLNVVRAHESVSPTEIAAVLGMTDDTAASTVANNCVWLVRYGFVRRVGRVGRHVHYAADNGDSRAP